MKYYYSKTYKNKLGKETQNVFFILNAEELERLTHLLVPLHATMLTWVNTSVKINDKDWQAFRFLQRMQAPPLGELIDPTDWQIEGIVNKLLIKVTGKDFIDWLMPRWEPGDMSAADLRQHMQEKRKQLAQKHKKPQDTIFDW